MTKILILGDIVGPAGRNAVIKKLPSIIKRKYIDFVVVNGENAADSGRGITKKISDELLNSGANVITSGNHIWDQKETMNFIGKETRLLRPINMIEGSPGAGFGIFRTKKNLEIAVVNFMGNIFMTKCDDLFNAAKKFIEEIKKKKI